MKSKGRAVLHKEILPKFAGYFKNDDKIVNIGTHRFWDYSTYFVNPDLLCEYVSTDLREVPDQITGNNRVDLVDNICQSKLESETVNGFLFIGMHDNISDPNAAYKEMYRILKPGGKILIAFPGSGAKCGGELVKMDEWRDFIPMFIVDEVHYVYGPENQERHTDEKNTSIIVIGRKPCG